MRARSVACLVSIALLSSLGSADQPAPPEATKTQAAEGSAAAPHAPVAEAAGPDGSAAPSAPSPLSYELRIGQGVYRYYCQTCHGETGVGDGFNAFNLDPHPRDLSDPAFQRAKSDADLADAIRRGGAGVGLSALMPPWGHTLSAQQIEAVIRYLRTLRKEPSPH